MLLERVVCGSCAVPMKCTKTGKRVCYNESVILSGDEFTCPSCGAVVIPITGDVVPAFVVKNYTQLLQVND